MRGRRRGECLPVADEVVAQVNEHQVTNGSQCLGLFGEDYGPTVDAVRRPASYIADPYWATARANRLR